MYIFILLNCRSFVIPRGRLPLAVCFPPHHDATRACVRLFTDFQLIYSSMHESPSYTHLFDLIFKPDCSLSIRSLLSRLGSIQNPVAMARPKSDINGREGIVDRQLTFCARLQEWSYGHLIHICSCCSNYMAHCCKNPC